MKVEIGSSQVYVGPQTAIYKEPLQDGFLDPELIDLYKQINQESFDNNLPEVGRLSFLCYARYSERKQNIATGLFYTNKTHSWYGIVLEISIKQNKKELLDTFKHELCHFLLCYQGKKYGDGDLEFAYLCGWVHAHRFHNVTSEVKEYDLNSNITSTWW